MAVNKLTEIAPMPQGNIRSKQQSLSGHTYICLFDFASGFYACKVERGSRPYTAFYVEGKGYFWCAKLPFGLTGAPSTFANMTARYLDDLIADGTIELFVDDGGSADDDFESMFTKLTRILERVRERDLSLSAAKSEFFMSEDIFAGGKVSKEGVTADPAKLTAIVEWKQPADALNLASFVGLTGHFRDLIRNYARIEGPLRNLLKSVPLPQNYTKSTYRRAMESFKLEGKWTLDHTRAFLALKKALVSEPVLKAPRWDGSSFVVTTDGCKEGFAAVVAQRFEVVHPNGTTTYKMHPVGFASKRTSSSEQNYKPFLLEFAALKFGLDKFSDMIWGFPVEIETDCQALRDVIANDKLNAAHCRWRDGILAHHIVDVRHIPGKLNVVADGLSRMWEGQDHVVGDGSEWTVSEDWEAVTGLVNDVFGVSIGDGVLRGEDTTDWTAMLTRFANEPVFTEVVEALRALEGPASDKVKQRAQHKAARYMVEDNRLWKVGGNEGIRERARVECVTKREAVALAKAQHGEEGHWGRDSTKLTLMDRIWSPKLDESIMEAIAGCPECKNSGATHLHALLNPITRRHPFELLVGDHLSMSKGKGGYKTIGLYLDTYSQRVWAFKFKVAGSGATTAASLTSLFNGYLPPETFMTDNGTHFANKEVEALCAKWGTKQHFTPAYSPWVNGLVEGTNKILLHVLKRLCAPKLGEDSEEFTAMTWDTLPDKWPEFLDEVVRIINNRILPSVKFSPNELLLGAVVNTRQTAVEEATSILPQQSVAVQAAYVAQQQLDGYNAFVSHAVKRKAVFDRRVLKKEGKEVVYRKGDLVQVYRSDLDYTFKAIKKIIPKWSRPYRVVDRIVNSYTLETADGQLIDGKQFNARRLREFKPQLGTKLAIAQQEVIRRREEHEKDA
ncbi:hypothetical protein HHX47_DHR8000253 [Lentinula edodes]|nr:hypothetical protein HHX47_DHR8000253 [Lentinula edodes]